MAERERIDVLLVEHGLFPSREKAKGAIMAGLVLVNAERIDKPGMKVPRDARLEVKGREHPYVSRGGLKLEKAIKEFSVSLKDAVMLDVGASTGGFTDCALQNGAAFVYAIDVGYNQLDWSIRNHPKVKVMERTNFRYLTANELTGPPPNMAGIDVSFISLVKILPVVSALLPDDGEVIALIKPQFEAGREQVGKSGVIRDAKIHREVLLRVVDFAINLGFPQPALTYSPITGGEGNIEFLAYWPLSRAGGQDEPLDEAVNRVVREAHAALTLR